MQRPQAQKLCDKMYPGCRVISFHESDATDGPVVLTTESKDCGEGKYYCCLLYTSPSPRDRG